MPVLEDTPKLSIRTLRASPMWSKLCADRGGLVDITTPDGCRFTATIQLEKDDRSRWRLVCGTCGTRRWDLYLHEGRLECRCCLRLFYAEQLWPESRWRSEIGRPILRQWRRAVRKATADPTFPAHPCGGDRYGPP